MVETIFCLLLLMFVGDVKLDGMCWLWNLMKECVMKEIKRTPC
jgi:hypothetical protein